MVLRRWLIVLLVMIPLCASAQVDDAIEQWMQEDVAEEQVAAAADMLMQLSYEPVNINDTAAVRDLPLMTPFRYRALCNYIMLYGQLLSTKELALIPGFDSVTVVLLSSMVKAEPYNGREKLQWWHGRHNVVTGLGGTVEQAAGYRDGRYEGDNLHALFCYNYNYRNKISVRLVADKDPGEAWGKGNFYGYHVMLSDIGRLDKLIVGRYGLQFGQGLTLWTGFKPFSIMGGTPERFGTGVRQASTFYETDYLEGAAATVRLWRGLHLSAFASRVQVETLAGGHAEWRSGNLVAGVTMVATRLDDSLAVRDYVYNQTRFRGQQLLNGGVDATWQWRRLTLYGEASLDGEGHPAAMAGVTLAPSSVNRFGVSYRYYHPLYHNLHAQGYSIGTTQGEQGMTFDASTQLPWGLNLLASVDLHRFAAPRYGSYSPSSGAWLRLQLSRQIGQWGQVTVRYADRLKERNIPNIDSTVYLGEQTMRRQLQGELKTKVGAWLFTTRAMYAHFESGNVEPQKGWLVAEAARYAKGTMQVTAGLTYFDVYGYYARLYMSESCLQYAWSIPMFYGKGVRAHMVVRWKISENFSLAAKYGVTLYLDRGSIGSGAAETEGPARQTWFVQLRVKM